VTRSSVREKPRSSQWAGFDGVFSVLWLVSFNLARPALGPASLVSVNRSGEILRFRVGLSSEATKSDGGGVFHAIIFLP
jgi:hypothetical protein